METKTEERIRELADAAEKMLLAIINQARINDGLPELMDLPKNAQIKD